MPLKLTQCGQIWVQVWASALLHLFEASSLCQQPGPRVALGRRSLPYFHIVSCYCPLQASLAAEARGTGVAVHLTSPGMVATDLLAASVEHNPRVAWILNILAEEPRTVAQWLAPRMRARIDPEP